MDYFQVLVKQITFLFFTCAIFSFAQPSHRPLRSPEDRPLSSQDASTRQATPRLDLAPLDAAAKPPRPQHPGVRAVGLGRAISPRVMQRGTWTTLQSGQKVWRVSIRSPRAWGVRVHFANFHIANGRVWLYRQGDNIEEGRFTGPYSGDGLLHDGEFWSEPVRGEEIVLEYAPADPGADSTDAPPFLVDQISHLFNELLGPPQAVGSLSIGSGNSGPADTVTTELNAVTSNAAQVQNSCSPDVACFSQWSTQSTAVASIMFTTGGASYLCTGSLVADQANSGQPYLVTANHCVSDDATARTVVAHFQYQATTCNGTAPDYFSVPKVAGARHLSSRPIAEGDFSLVLLSAAPPAGSTYLSWTAGAEPAPGASVAGIHHPGHVIDGSAPNSKRISFGTRDRAQDANIAGDVMPADKNIFVTWSPGQGYTEPGSSGSPLLSQNGQIVGTLTGGSEGKFLSACNPSSAVGVYGKFATALQTIGAILGCDYTLGASNTQFDPSGGTGSISLTTLASCGWQISADAEWLHWAGPVAGNGSGSLSFTLDPNTSTVDRSATVTAGSRQIRITQAGSRGVPATLPVVACSGTLPAQTITIGGGGGTADLGLPQTSTCSWTLTTRAAWLGLSAGVVPGGGTAILTAGANPSDLARATTVTTGALAAQVLQAPRYASSVFNDVAASHPFSNYVSLIKNNGITAGCTTVQYCPDASTTRGQMAVFIIRGLLRTDQFSYASVPYFEDVPASHPSFRYVQKMKELGITGGCSTTPARYCADDPVSRAQMAVFLIRSKYGDSFPFTQAPYFSDVTGANSEFAYVQKLRDLGITSGCSATEYCGSASTTRAQMASFLVRTFLSGL
jgi:hypothetical protein